MTLCLKRKARRCPPPRLARLKQIIRYRPMSWCCRPLRPIRMEELAAGLIQPFIGMRTKIISLGLEQISWQELAGIAVEIV